MKKLLLLLVLFLAVLLTVVSDIYKRGQEGIPDPRATGIHTLLCPSDVRVGFAAVNITPYLETDGRLGATGLPEERSIHLFLDLIEPPRDSANIGKRKSVNSLFIKCLVFADKKRPLAALFSADLPFITQAHLDSLETALKTRFSLDRRFVHVLTPGLLNTFSCPPASFSACAVKALEQALEGPAAAEWAYVSPKKFFRPANLNRVDLAGVGTCRVPPLCGPIVDNRQYDATEPANAWLGALSENPEKFAPLSLETRPCSLSVHSMLLFRTLETQQIFGGIVLSGVPPCIVPPAKTGGDISSDYVFHLCDHLERKLGGTFLFARSPGAGLIPFIDAFSHPSAHRYGISVGSGLTQYVKEARWEKLKKARFYHREGLALPLKEEAALPDSELAARAEKYRAQSLSIRGANLDLSTKRGIQDRYLSPHYLRAHFSRFGRPRETAIKALRLNRFFFVSLPGEHFLKTSAALKNAVPGTELCVADHAGEYISSLVPEEEWLGGFEPNRSLFSPQAWQKLMDEAAGLVRAARSGEDAQGRP